MKTQAWVRADVVASVHDDVWRFVSQAAQREEGALLEAAALLNMRPHELRTLAHIQFIVSPEVRRLLDAMPQLIRKLRTATISEQETSAERVRGAIQWGPTLSNRLATGLPHLYVTAPARRAYDTPENQVLAFALQAIRTTGRRTGWHRSASPELGARVRDTVAEAERWLRTRMLSKIRTDLPTPQLIARVRASRARGRYQPALDVAALHNRYIRRLDRDALRHAVQDNALVTSKDDRLLELVCGFAIERALKKLGWEIRRPGLVAGGLFLRAQRDDTRLDLYYQSTPKDLSKGSLYYTIQRQHPFSRAGALIPDFVFRINKTDQTRWLLVEVKGVERSVSGSARAALHDLLAYRRAFDPVLAEGMTPYGLGIAWGSSLSPSTNVEVSLCTPDTVEAVLAQLLGPLDS